MKICLKIEMLFCRNSCTMILGLKDLFHLNCFENNREYHFHCMSFILESSDKKKKHFAKQDC